MKMKKLAPMLALTLCVSALSGCTGDQKVSFHSYWQQDSHVKESVHETLVYNVAFTPDAGLDKIGYGLSYDNGQYKTVLVSEEVDGKTVYTYTTELNITVTYTLNGESESFTDTIVSVSKFYDVYNALKPISSEKNLVSHTPTSSGSKSELSACYQAFEYSVSTIYDADGKSGVAAVAQKGQTSVENRFEIDEKKYSYLDNEVLLFAARGLNSVVTSAKLISYSPFAKAVQTVGFNFAAEESASFTFLKNGEERTQTITYRPMTMVLNEKNPGASQTAWIAKTTDSQNNLHRNVILKLQTPLSYSLGTLVYTLASATYE